MTLQGNVREALNEYFVKELENQLDLVDGYLEYEKDPTRTQNAIIRKRAELCGYISCLDDLDVFEDFQLNEMYDKVDKAFDERQEILDKEVAR